MKNFPSRAQRPLRALLEALTPNFTSYNVAMYSRQVLEHFQDRRHVGQLEDADAYVRVDNPVCGDVLDLTIKVDAGRIVAAKFRARGCVAAIACGSQLSEMILNRTIAEARALRPSQLVQALGGLPKASMHASHMAIDALTTALKRLAVDRPS